MPSVDKQTYLLLQLLFNQQLQKCSNQTELLSRSRNFVSKSETEELGIDIEIEEGTIDEEVFLRPESVLVEDKDVLNMLENFYLVKDKVQSIILMYSK